MQRQALAVREGWTVRTHAPRVSVVIPTHNRATSIDRSIASVLNQSLSHLEVIVVDDGSTDDTMAMLTSIDDPRLRIFRIPSNSNSPSLPRNTGVAASTGEWVAFLDSDDTWHPTHLEDLLGHAAATDAHMVCSNAQVDALTSTNYFDAMPPSLTVDTLLATNWVITSSVLVTRSALTKVGHFPAAEGMPIYEDYAVWLRLATLGDIQVLQRETLTYQRDSPNSVGATMNPDEARPNTLADFNIWRSRLK
jgi:teichuronic acid biosynthesis glycosyltransferase TuaG